MSEQSWIQLLQQQRAIAVIRADNIRLGQEMAQAVASGGINLIEITGNSARAFDLINQLRQELPNCTIGTGTLLNVQAIKEAIAAGAEFIFTPHVNQEMIQTALKLEVPMIPGALSPTEIVTAWQAGASCVKVFPIQSVGGVNYIKNLQGPLGNIPLIPTGGVTIENAKDFLNAGAIAVGISGSLFPKQLVADRNWEAIRCLATRLRTTVDGH